MSYTSYELYNILNRAAFVQIGLDVDFAFNLIDLGSFNTWLIYYFYVSIQTF